MSSKSKPKYNEKDLQNALLAVDEGMKIYQAAKKYNIPSSTLHDKVKGKTPRFCKQGRPTYLTETEKNLLVE